MMKNQTVSIQKSLLISILKEHLPETDKKYKFLNQISNTTNSEIEIHADNSNINNNPSLICISMGKNFNPTKYYAQWTKLGHFILHDNQSNNGETHLTENIFSVENCFLTIKNKIFLSANDIKNENFKTFAVTGTNGKTSSTQLIHSLLSLTKKNATRIGTLGVLCKNTVMEHSFPTMPSFSEFVKIALFSKQNNCSHLVIEATSIGLKEQRLGEWLCDVASFSNLTPDHLDYHQTMFKYALSKNILFKNHLKKDATVVFNFESKSAFAQMFLAAGKLPTRALIGFGSSTEKQMFFAHPGFGYGSELFLESKNIGLSLSGMNGSFCLHKRIGKFEQKLLSEESFSCPLLGKFQIENISLALANLLALFMQNNSGVNNSESGNFDFEIAKHFASTTGLLPKLEGIPGRLQKVNITNKQPTVLVDYAHSPDALHKALKFCAELMNTEKNGGKIICVFGCGGDRDPLKRKIMGEIASSQSHECYVTSDNPRTEDPLKIINEICSGISKKERLKIEPDRKAAIISAIRSAKRGDIVLVAGKGHEEYQILNTTKYPFSDVLVAQEALQNLL
jgi:UDP-N-acetylmuramoyl-L-alanyl-D-glutamate--2,6-diaminopimelate ligase